MVGVGEAEAFRMVIAHNSPGGDLAGSHFGAGCVDETHPATGVGGGAGQGGGADVYFVADGGPSVGEVFAASTCTEA